MNIYFAGSIRGGREDREFYFQLIDYLKQFGTVLTEHVGKKELSLMGEDGLTNPEIHDRDMGWLEKAKNVVAEVTQASLGVGYELGRIVERNLWVPKEDRKRVLCLYRPQIDRKLSAMITGCQGIINVQYQTLDEAKKSIDDFCR